jgi:hypothetical protein
MLFPNLHLRLAENYYYHRQHPCCNYLRWSSRRPRQLLLHPCSRFYRDTCTFVHIVRLCAY